MSLSTIYSFTDYLYPATPFVYPIGILPRRRFLLRFLLDILGLEILWVLPVAFPVVLRSIHALFGLAAARRWPARILVAIRSLLRLV